VGTAYTPLTVSVGKNYPQSHLSVLNVFRSDFEDFSFFSDLSLKLPYFFKKSKDTSLF
jgi:hypothetical protein